MHKDEWCAKIEAWLKDVYEPWYEAHAGDVQPLSGGEAPPPPPKKS